jgi:hypothetical protein
MAVAKDPGDLGLPIDDPDLITDEDRAAAEKEAKAEEEATRLAKEQEQADAKKQRSLEQVEAETARLRHQRDTQRVTLGEQDKELAKLREENAAFKARQQIAEEERKAKARVDETAGRPDPTEDPYGAQLWDATHELNDLKKWKAEQAEKERQTLEAEQARADNMKVAKEIDDFLLDDVTKWKEEHADGDYDGKAEFVYRAYLNTWKRTGLTEDEARLMVANTFAGIGRAAMMKGKSAAEAIAGLADEIGYKPKLKEEGKDNGAGGKETSAQKIARLNKAQKLQGLGGKVPNERSPLESPGSLSAEELAEMSDDDYLALKQSPDKGRLLQKRLEDLG